MKIYTCTSLFSNIHIKKTKAIVLTFFLGLISQVLLSSFSPGWSGSAALVKTSTGLEQPTVKRYPIFGRKYELVETKTNYLKGSVYYLVSGHGGPDPGAMGKYQNHVLCEDEYAYDITIRLARNLVENGATVYMITMDPNDGIRDETFLMPDKDAVCYPNQGVPLNKLKRLD